MGLGRYYDPQIGRFLSEDPIGLNAGDFNFYRFVSNNAISSIDPSGELAWVIAAGLFGGGANAIQYWDAYNSRKMSKIEYASAIAWGATSAALGTLLLGVGGALFGVAAGMYNDSYYNQFADCEDQISLKASILTNLIFGFLDGIGSKMNGTKQISKPDLQVYKSIDRGNQTDFISNLMQFAKTAMEQVFK